MMLLIFTFAVWLFDYERGRNEDICVVRRTSITSDKETLLTFYFYIQGVQSG